MAALLFAALGTTALADDAPVIHTDVPAALTVIEGQTLTLTVEATGGELSYQWYRVHPEGDAPVEGQTSNTYQIASVDASINGAAFYCFVQNVAGNTQSSVCTVTVLSKPVLTQDVSTTSQTLTEGDTITLTAGATGAAGSITQITSSGTIRRATKPPSPLTARRRPLSPSRPRWSITARISTASS